MNTPTSSTLLKHCRICGLPQPTNCFPKWSHKCLSCTREMKKQDSKKYYHDHKNSPEFKEKIKAGRKSREQANRVLHLQKKHEAYIRNREWYNSNWHARRAIAAGASEVDRSITISKLLERDQNICGICGSSISITPENHSGKPSIDHIIPLRYGGQHTWENVRAAHCGCNNSRKNQLDGSYKVNTSFLHTV